MNTINKNNIKTADWGCVVMRPSTNRYYYFNLKCLNIKDGPIKKTTLFKLLIKI